MSTRSQVSERVADLSSSKRILLEQALLGRKSLDGARPAIPRIAGKDQLPLSFGEERIWFVDRLAPGSTFYNVPTAVSFTGALDLEALSRALDAVIARHDRLRVRFESVAGRPVQRIEAPRSGALLIEDATGWDDQTILRMVHDEAEAPFDLERGPLIRARLLRRGENANVLLITMHHITTDGWSQSILRRDLGSFYRAFRRGEPCSLPDLSIEYVDYAAWQRRQLSAARLEQHLRFWKGYLEGAPTSIDLPTDRPRPVMQTFRGADVRFALPEELSARIRDFSRKCDVTVFMTLLTAFATLLARYAKQSDLVIGVPVAGRARSELEPLVGFFVNTLALRIPFDGTARFVDMLERTRGACLEVFKHDELPFEKVVEMVNPARDSSRHPLFQVAFSVHAHMEFPLVLDDLKSEEISIERRAAMFDLTLDMIEEKTGLIGYFQYNTALFDRATIQRMAQHFEVLLHSTVARPEGRVGKLAMLTAEERHYLIVTLNEPR